MEQFLNEITPALLQLMSTVVIALVGWATVKVKGYFDEKGISEKLNQYDYLADIAVKAVEQIYQNEDGEVKKQKAKDYIIDSLDDLNLTITPQQLDMFIESAVKRAKEEWDSI